METARRMHYSYEEYLTLEGFSQVRHEYLDGEIYAMSGGTPEHAMLAGRLIGAIAPQLRPECELSTSDLRVRIPATGLSTYPDIAVVCSAMERASDDKNAATNPVLLVEVTSDSTEDYDRGEKLRHYQRIPNLREVLIASHRKPVLTLYRRGDDGRWTIIEAGAGETLTLTSIGATLTVDAIYRPGPANTSFPT